MTPRELWVRLTYPFRQGRLERELREEIDLHVALRAARLEEAGVSRADAVAAARRRFGNRSRVLTAARAAWGWHWFDGLGQDLRYVLRQVRRSPGFALVVIATIALGIGINATAFEFYDAIVLKPLPVGDPSRVVRIVQNGRAFGFERLPYTAYDVLRRNARAFQGVTLTTGPQSFAAALPGENEELRIVSARFVSPDFAPMLGVGARIGRWFDATDERAAVLDHAFWTRALNGDPSVLGRRIRVGGTDLTIVGIAPERFAGTGMPAVAPDVWLPVAALPTIEGADWRTDGGMHWQMLARLAPGLTLGNANAELEGLRSAVPDSVGQPLPIVARQATFFQTDAGEFEVFQQASDAFMAALALMLGIAVVNLVNLFAARNAARQGEMTVRLALGAGHGRIARQLASESLLLALGGGALGLVVSQSLAGWAQAWMTTTVASISGGLGQISLDLSVDWRVSAYAAVLAIGIGLVVGLWPALRATRGNVNTLLRQGSTSTSDAATWGKRNALLALQIASCIVLLTGAGMLLGGMRLSRHIDPRFDAQHMLMIDFQDDSPIAERAARRREIMRRLSSLGNVHAVAWTRRVPFGGTHLRRVDTAHGSLTLSLDEVSESYFDTMGMPIRRGRTFSASEVESSAPVMLVSEATARLRWPNADPIGKTIPPHDGLAGPDTTKTYTIIGVVGDIRSQFLSRLNGPSAYYTWSTAEPSGAVLVRTTGAPSAAIKDVRIVVGSVAPSLASRTRVLTIEDGPMALQRLMAQTPAAIALLLALIGLALASVGVYGVISQIVTRRTREIGIYVAIGARPGQVVRLVARKTLRPVAWGALLGGVGAFALSLFLRSLISTPDVPDLTFGAGAFNPIVFGGVLAVLALVVTAAFLVPARRAIRVDPMLALRAE